MNPTSTTLLALSFSLMALSALRGDSAQTAAEPPAQPRSFIEEVFTAGKFTFDLRLRYEYADQSGLDASHAATARTRLGYGTNTDFPLFGYIELEDVTALDSDAYNQAGLNGQGQKTVIADPEITELNQAFLHFKRADFSARVGRQRLILDNHRFVGNVGWRQNEQTFDGLTFQHKWTDDAAFLYSYIDQVNRVFGRDHAMGRWDSSSHIINIRHPLPIGSMGAYTYLLQFDEAPAMSADTFGLWVRPLLANLPRPLTVHLELAYQADNNESSAGADFDHFYFRTELETKIERFSVGGGFERLGGDGTTAFQTPLATLHAFNGWADQFLQTPARGLDDAFAFVATPLPADFTARANGHYFTSHRGDITYGHELDLVISRPLGKYATTLAKAAFFDGKDNRPDVTKFWLQAEVRF